MTRAAHECTNLLLECRWIWRCRHRRCVTLVRCC